MNPKYYISRFKELQKIHMGGGNLLITSYMLLDYLLSYLIYGASISDYFAYGFFKLKHKGRKEYITYRRHKKIQKICNPDSKAIQICRDKRLFNDKFSNLLGRKWLDIDKASFEEFSQFIDKADSSFFVKGIEGFCGNDVWKEDKTVDKQKLYSSLKSKGKYILEETIKQYGELADFNPSSVNTIRITTIYDKKTDEVNIMKANIRIGGKNSNIDNLHAGGLAAHVDIDSGIIYKPAYDKKNNLFISHPYSNKQIVGLKIPYWDECKDFVIKAARLIPEVGYIGWDIVSLGDGNFCLIEANDNGDHDIQQINDKGIWKEYQKVLKQLK